MSFFRFLNSLPVFWFVLAIPGFFMLNRYFSGEVIAMDMLHPTGEWSARFMIIAMLVSPMMTVFGNRGWLKWLLARRRSFGLAAFGYGLLHLIFYVVDMEEVSAMLAEIDAPGIWTGWLAFFIFIPLAITSSNAAMRALGKRWKSLQRLVYLAALLTLAHWVLIHDGLNGAIVHFAPLVVFQLLRGIIIYSKGSSKAVQTE